MQHEYTNKYEKVEEVITKRQEVKENNDFKKQTEELLKSILSKESNIPVEELDSNTGFDVLGLDSIMITNISMTIDQYFLGIPKTVFFEFSTIADLTNYIFERYKNTDIPFFSTEQHDDLNEIYEQDNEVKDKKSLNDNKEDNKEIALIGVSGIYPKASDISEFWNNLKEGRDCVDEIPAERWDSSIHYSETQKEDGRNYCKWGGFISEYNRFDPLFFNISPKDAEWMDPQERLFIQEVWHTLENAGYTKESLKGKKVGVFVAVTNGQYQLLQGNMKGTNVSPLISYASLANRISYLFNFNGPSLAIDTMCSSFLTSNITCCLSKY